MIGLASQSPNAGLAQLPPEIRCGLDQLARAFGYAEDLDSPRWDFAVEIERLLALGMTTSDLRWLIKRGYLSHAREITAPQDADRRFEPSEQNLAFAKNSCFVITEAGLAILAQSGRGEPCGRRNAYGGWRRSCRYLAQTGLVTRAGPVADSQIDLPSRALAARQPRQTLIPSWNRNSRTFSPGLATSSSNTSEYPRQIRKPSWMRFRKRIWPASIDDPLPPLMDQQPKLRLRETITSPESESGDAIDSFPR